MAAAPSPKWISAAVSLAEARIEGLERAKDVLTELYDWLDDDERSKIGYAIRTLEVRRERELEAVEQLQTLERRQNGNR